MTENWKPLPDFEYHYLVSDRGRVKRASSGRILKLKTNIDGYNVVCLSVNNIKKEVRVARKVAEAFISKPLEGEVVNHIDGVKSNDTFQNLERTTVAGNTQHAYDNNLANSWLKGVKGDKNPFSKEYIIFTPDNIKITVKGLTQFAKDYKLCIRSLFRVLSGELDNYKGYKIRRSF